MLRRSARTAAGVGLIAALCLVPVMAVPAASPAPIVVVAAENFYGDAVEQIAGEHARVTSVLSDPNVDPHEYETNSTDAAAVSDARLVIQNGIGYDDFVNRLMKASPNPSRTLIVVANLMGHKRGDNPHIWYDPATMPKVAQAVTEALAKIDPTNARAYRGRLAVFQNSLRPLNQKIASLKARRAGAPVAFTEPVFGYMGQAIGLKILTPLAFQKAIEEGEEPPAGAIATMEDQLRGHKVKVLIYDVQTVTPITTRIQKLAKQLGIPVVGVSETEPPHKTYQQWMLAQLEQVDAALGVGK